MNKSAMLMLSNEMVNDIQPLIFFLRNRQCVIYITYNDPRVIGHIQDGDVNSKSIINNLNKEIIIYYDAYHMKGKFKRTLEKFNEKGGNCFNPIKHKLMGFF